MSWTSSGRSRRWIGCGTFRWDSGRLLSWAGVVGAADGLEVGDFVGIAVGFRVGLPVVGEVAGTNTEGFPKRFQKFSVQ